MNRRVFAAWLTILLLVVPAGSSLRADATHYTVEDLGTIDGLVPTVTGMNASGQVSGYISRPDGLRAVRFTDGIGWTYLPGLQSVYSVATAINASGDLTGYYFEAAGLRAYRYVDGAGVTTIAALPGGTFGVGFAISANGDVVGYGNSSAGTRAWRASPGLPPAVPSTLGSTFSMACGVNEGGQIVGSFATPAGYQHAFRLEPDDSLTDIGTLEGPSGTSTACAIDGNGRVGGRSSSGDNTHAFRSDGGTLTDINALGSTFSSVDAVSAGVSVGLFISPADGTSRAFINTDTDGSSDLNDRIPSDSGWVLSEATAVNNKGQIAGQGLVGGTPRAFRLTPAASVDGTAPTITSLSATPSSITPPNKAMVAVTVSATATDDRDPNPVCAVSAIDGHGAPATDFSISGPLAGTVRATGGVTYTFTVTCRDAAGNTASGAVNVVVPPDTTPPVFTSLTATPSTIWPPKNQTVVVTTSATATDDSGEMPTCKLGNITGPGTAPTDFDVTGANTGTVKAVGGRTYTFNEICVDGSGNAAWSSVPVTVPPDTTAPVIASVGATPSTVWPPNGALVQVTVSVSATDDVDDVPVCALASITSTGATTDDYAITGAFSAMVRAVGGRTYALHVTCSDAAGNHSSASVNVVVPPDTTAPTITALSASPSVIWPPNGKMVKVTLSVSATDDVDAVPQCALTSVSGAPADAVVTGPFTASVRANKGAVYTLRVACGDRAGNKSEGAVSVTVSKD